MQRVNGFSLLELLISLAIIGLLMLVAVPSLHSFIVETYVDNQILSLQRLLLITRNASISNEQAVTFCPLNNNVCTNEWHQELSVFIDANNNQVYEEGLGERRLAVKEPVDDQYLLQYGTTRTSITYAPTGHLAAWGQNATFSVCPTQFTHLSRGITVATSGRFYVSSNNNSAGVDKNRNGRVISCH